MGRNTSYEPKGRIVDGVWLPDPEEFRPCCRRYLWKVQRYPKALWYHCRSLEHRARVAGISVKELKRQEGGIR